MKKILVLALTLVFVLTLSACRMDKTAGKNSKNNQNGSLTSDIMSSVSDSANSSADNSSATNTNISRESAIDIALMAAGIAKADAYDIEAELDTEFGEVVWDVDFESGNKEYSYNISARTGAVFKQESEPNY